MLNCTGSNAEYVDSATCLAMCGAFAAGTAGDTSGDTLACRTYHAGAAATNPTFHCPHAGFTGGNLCGDRCKGFCEADISQCGTVAYTNEASCEVDCAGYTYAPDAGDLTQTGGPSLQCRIYHLEASFGSAAGAKALHCPHTAPMLVVDGGTFPCQ
jgi:hypothetical protein